MALALGLGLGFLGCAGGKNRVPWPEPEGRFVEPHAEVRTLGDYDRTSAKLLVRKVARPSRANLDYAAYAANFLIADPPPEWMPEPEPGAQIEVAAPFEGALEAASLAGSIRRTPLTEAERASPLALEPLAAWLASQEAKLATGLEDLLSTVRSEGWGMGSGPLARQVATLGYLHAPSGGGPAELWVRIEFQPWFEDLGDLPDEDGDGFPEIYGRARPGTLKTEALELIERVYVGEELDAAGVASWAHKLASYWYPSYNTDLVDAAPSWPDDSTEAGLRAEAAAKLEGLSPTVVMRGKPAGTPVYNVFVVATLASASASAPKSSDKGSLRLKPGKVTPQPQTVAAAIRKELAETGGGSWGAWGRKVAPFHQAVRKRLQNAPKATKGMAGDDGFLFFRNGLEYVVAGDLQKQPKKKQPLAVIVEWKQLLERHGVDFLFVPVPDKAEVFPDKLVPGTDPFAGRVVNPFARKFLLDLAEAGVETVDLWPPFLQARGAIEGDGKTEPVFQRQDTHWTARGLALAAETIAARIKRYPWYGSLPVKPAAYKEKAASFSRYGDLHARLPEGQKRKYQPEPLVGRQVVAPDGSLYAGDPESPIVVLGDSFTGVYELTDCEHAGVAAHVAKRIGFPVDLVMSYGGGPNVRHKLMRRGTDGLAGKRLVVWIMTARDLYNYWEAWEPIGAKPNAQAAK